LAGHFDWRLPTIYELQNIYVHNVKVGRYHVKGNLQLSGWFEWSSSLGKASWSSSLGKASGSALGFLFIDGVQSSSQLGASGHDRTLCVRRSGE
jgi:hypothetical protein